MHPSAPVGEALREVARDVSRRGAHRDRSRRRNPTPSAVHDFRRAMKRWRALLRLLEPFVGQEARRLRDEARDLARALSGARDAQSALDALADLEKHGLALSARSIAGLRQRIEAIRKAAETTLDADMRLRLGSALDQAAAMVDRWPLSAVTFDDVADQLTRFYRERATAPSGGLVDRRPGGTARTAQAGCDPSLSDRHHRAAVAALRQDVDGRSATAARPARQAPGRANARKPHRTASAPRTLALAACARDRRTPERACRGCQAHRRRACSPKSRARCAGGSMAMWAAHR